MKSRKWIYVAGPYTNPDPVVNTRKAWLAGLRLYEAGLFPYVPHLSIAAQMIEPKPYVWWLDFDLAALLRCDALLRLPGPSIGADLEIEAARKEGIPVFTDEQSAIAWGQQ